MIVALPHNEEAAYFIIYDRYRGLLFSIYQYYFGKSFYWFDDCMHELFLSLRGAEGNWMSFSNFEWRANLRTWLTEVSKNKFLDCYKKLIEKSGYDTSNDKEKEPVEPVDLARQIQLIELMEAIGKLEDADQKFCILKDLEGYKHKEIAILLKKRWDKYGIVRYNKKKEVIIPDEGYVNVRIQRAKNNLREMFLENK